jgi:hypothetical protein
MPNFGWSSEWDKFTDYLSEYYYLDGEQFNEITCEIYPSATKSLTSNIQRDIEYQNLGLEIIENANDFKFTRKNTGEISFQKPEFDIRIPQPYYHQNIEEIEKWVNDVKSYYVQTIESVSVAAGAFFNFLKKPGKDDLKLVLF